MITVYTCILNGYDNLRPPGPVTPSARYVCYANEPMHCDPWEIQPAYEPYEDSRINSRIPKILSHLHTDNAEVSAWHDGCLTAKCDIDALAREWLRDVDMALLRHPGREDIYAEAAYCRRDAGALGFDGALQDAIDEQVARYKADGFPGAPFFAGGIIVRRENEAVRRFNEMWWNEFLRGGRRDQFSLAYSAWKARVRVRVIEGQSPLTCPWFSFNFHSAFERAGLNPQFAAERAARAGRKKALRELCV